ncbi:tRNA isopentenyltransferase [Zalerion maritima]|uniref:tRNA dimethylallyltransferase n=1 Tax=Zalerion maritima TaxID=339359 RepID=A0AAD5WRE4_9PEZI|nr:tRNA isopentenyltransferase [Zalerion maritima]
MAAKPRQDPLVVIFGSTGTGKSDLAVELALRFNGEIINADAMQMYRGMPIVTNKMTVEEQRGVPHHLLGIIDVNTDTWDISKFKPEASAIIHDIRKRGRLPIVVGGTHYYVDSLLFNDRAIEVEEPADSELSEHPILNGPPELIYQKLREVDPIMADRWHPNEIRKIRRSLQIFLRTGRRASDIYAEQERKRFENQQEAPWPALLFWVYTEPETLEERLRTRVDKMVDRGVLDEVQSQLDSFSQAASAKKNIDYTKGIWQSVGPKELKPYFKSAAKEPRLLNECLENMKVATRQCAKGQLRYIRLRTIRGLEQHGLSDSLYLVDSSDLSQWKEDVVEPAMQITNNFLAGTPLPLPTAVSTTARAVLLDNSHKKGVHCRKVCDTCNRTFTMEHEWEKHLKGRNHRRALQRARRRALVVASDAGAVQESPG